MCYIEQLMLECTLKMDGIKVSILKWSKKQLYNVFKAGPIE